MMNEIIFASHICLISLSTILFAKFGKEALIAYISLLFVVANIFVVKQINLFGFSVTSADAFIVGISFGINIIQEFYDKQTARKAVFISFACSLFYMLTTWFILSYQPASVDNAHNHLLFVMSHTTRLVFASFVAYLITQFTDIYIYSFMKQATKGRFFVLRNYFALCMSQFTDTVLFSFLGLWGIVHALNQVMFMSYIIKIFAIIMLTPFLLITKKILKRKDHVL